MKFKNAAKGIAKIYSGEIMLIFAMMFVLVGTVLSAVKGSQENQTMDVVILILMAVAGVLSVVSFIVQMIGLAQAGKDNSYFSVGFWIVIFSIVLSALGGVLESIGGYGIAVSIIKSFANFSTTIVMLYVIRGISVLAFKSGHPLFAAKGKIFGFIVFGFFVVSVVFTMLATFLDSTNPVLATAMGIFGIVAVVLTTVLYIMYLLYLNKARKLLR